MSSLKYPKKYPKRVAAGGAALLLPGLLLAGCGGGGGNGNTVGTGTTSTGTATGTNTSATGTAATAQIAGKVTDLNGRGLPGVSISVDTGGQITTTISTGGYRLTNLTEAVHKVSATVTVNGVQYTGSTQVAATANALTSNGNLVMSPAGQQATVQGIVSDAGGKPVAGAGVYLAVPNTATDTSAGNYSSLAAFTNASGVYVIPNVPAAGLPAGSLLMTASAAGAANQSVTLPAGAVSPGGTVTQNFTLTPLASGATAAADQPTVAGVQAFTQPASGLTGSALQSRLLSGSSVSGTVYETLRRTLSPSYAAWASRRAGLGKRVLSRATATGYAVEVDLAFNPPAATNVNLAGYNIYRSTGALAANPISESNFNFSDSLVDPLANYYVAVTATSDLIDSAFPNTSYYTAGTTYNFAVSSVSTTRQESMISTPAVTITPLGPLTVNAPVSGGTVSSPVTLSWTPVAGATKYYIFVYAQYPTVGSSPFSSSPTPFPAGTSSAALTLPAGATYYAVVVAAADQTETVGATTPVFNAAQSYSAITPFTVR